MAWAKDRNPIKAIMSRMPLGRRLSSQMITSMDAEIASKNVASNCCIVTTSSTAFTFLLHRGRSRYHARYV